MFQIRFLYSTHGILRNLRHFFWKPNLRHWTCYVNSTSRMSRYCFSCIGPFAFVVPLHMPAENWKSFLDKTKMLVLFRLLIVNLVSHFQFFGKIYCNSIDSSKAQTVSYSFLYFMAYGRKGLWWVVLPKTNHLIFSSFLLQFISPNLYGCYCMLYIIPLDGWKNMRVPVLCDTWTVIWWIGVCPPNTIYGPFFRCISLQLVT
jgi:hypothetical protein